jgi:septal ring factor EnvC (AmiA/AmiB activator)
MRLLALAALALLSCQQHALASGSAPVPQNKRQALEHYQKQVSEEKAKERQLRTKVQQAERELENTRGELVGLAHDIKSNEQELQKLESRISSMQIEKKELVDSLQADFGNIGDLLLALQRIRRVPPEALLARPGAPLETAQSAMLLKSTLPSLQKHADRLQNNLDRLEKLERELKSDKKKLMNEKRELDERRKKLSVLLKQRKDLYNQTRGQHERQQKILENIASRARDLKELVEELDKKRKRMETRRLARRDLAASPPPRSFSPDYRTETSAAGKSRLPVAGFIKINYGGYDELDAKSNGITIQGRKGGLVVAPMSGEVRFAGPFKRFGNLVIIEHSGGYHSLVAGLARIDTLAGRTISKGEPVGMLDDDQATLYYELRHNGVPVNPALKLGYQEKRQTEQ